LWALNGPQIDDGNSPILFRNFGTYLRLSGLPFLILFVASTGMQFFYRDVAGLGDEGQVLIGAIGQLFEGSLWLLTIPVATAWTRMVLLNAEQRVQLFVGRAEAIYLWRYVCLSLVALPPLLPFGVIVLLAWKRQVHRKQAPDGDGGEPCQLG